MTIYTAFILDNRRQMYGSFFIQDAQDVKAVKVLEIMVGFKEACGKAVHKDIQVENAEKYLKTS